MKIICNDCGKNIIFKHEKSIYLSYDRKIAESKGFKNLEKLTDDELININYVRLYINSLTNNDGFYLTENDYKFGYREMISEGTEISCKYCHTRYESCFRCNKHYKSSEMNKYLCLDCYKKLELEDPSTSTYKCKFDKNKMIWYLNSKKCPCCGNEIYKNNEDIFWIPEFSFQHLSSHKDFRSMLRVIRHYYLTSCIKCYENCIVHSFKNIFKKHGYDMKLERYEQNGINFKILLKKKCNCGNDMPWIDSYFIYYDENKKNTDKYLYKCKNCDPSTNEVKYVYSNNGT